MLKSRSFKLELKEFGEAGTFTGLAAVYGNKDQGGDVIDPGAFTKTLADRGGEVPILYQHNPSEPIGLGKLTDSKEGLLIEGKLVMESPVAQKTYALMKAGVLKGLSIGYDTISHKDLNGTRYLKEVKLWEVSTVTFPMNERAMVTGVKSSEEIDSLLAEVRECATISEEFKTKFLALAGEFAPPAAKEDAIAPEVFHAVDSLSNYLKGDLKWVETR